MKPRKARGIYDFISSKFSIKICTNHVPALEVGNPDIKRFVPPQYVVNFGPVATRQTVLCIVFCRCQSHQISDKMMRCLKAANGRKHHGRNLKHPSLSHGSHVCYILVITESNLSKRYNRCCHAAATKSREKMSSV